MRRRTTTRSKSRTTATKRGRKAHKKYEGEMVKGEISTTYQLSTPYKLVLKRKRGNDTTISMNLNWYRNATFFQQNEAKQLFTAQMEEILKPVKLPEKITITYTLFTKDRRVCDVANVCSIVDKFFSDCLTYYDCITDDDYRYLPKVTYRFGKIDPGNPRVDILIEEIE